MSEIPSNTLTLLGPGMCGDGSCPAIYRDNSGRIFVQGTKVEALLKKLVFVPEHEEIVELPSELIALLKQLDS
jgi:hypothetical protein